MKATSWQVIGGLSMVGLALFWASRENNSRAPTRSASISPTRQSKSPVQTQMPPREIGSQHLATSEKSAPSASIDAIAWAKSRQELSLYHAVKQKVFANPGESQQASRILHDPAILRQAGYILRSPTGLSQEADESLETSAVDLLVEAYIHGDRSVAWQTILEVIKDPALEDPQLALPLRQRLAGLKGELMYHVAALTPQLASVITAAASGSATATVWRNVRELHQQNQELSQTELGVH